MQRSPVSWKLSEEKASLFIRTLKYLHTVGETITFIVRPDRLELYNESSDNCAVLIATFKSQFFNEFQGTANRIFAVFSKNLTMITDPQKTSIIGLWFLYRNEEYLDIVINYNTGVNIFESFITFFYFNITKKWKNLCGLRLSRNMRDHRDYLKKKHSNLDYKNVIPQNLRFLLTKYFIIILKKKRFFYMKTSFFLRLFSFL